MCYVHRLNWINPTIRNKPERIFTTHLKGLTLKKELISRGCTMCTRIRGLPSLRITDNYYYLKMADSSQCRGRIAHASKMLGGLWEERTSPLIGLPVLQVHCDGKSLNSFDQQQSCSKQLLFVADLLQWLVIYALTPSSWQVGVGYDWVQ